MSDRRTFLGNAAAAAVMSKISSLRSFGFATDSPETIDPTISDREKAELRGPVAICVQEGGWGDERKSLTTTEYSPDGKLLATRSSYPDGTEWVSKQAYDADGRLSKIISGRANEPGFETLYAYDEEGRLKGITDGNGKGNHTSFQYDEQGRKTTIQKFAPEVLERNQQNPFLGYLWSSAEEGFGVPMGGSVTTIYNDRDQQAELQIRDAEGRPVSRIVRTYDAKGRLIEEKPIQENAGWMFAGLLPAEKRAELNDKQLEAMNRVVMLMLGGRNGARISYAYDAQGRVTQMRSCNFAVDRVTTTSYNEHGDKSEERSTVTGNETVPTGTAYSIDENGNLIPDKRNTELTESPDLSGEEEVRYTYQYDSYGNWTGQTVNYSSSPDGPSYVCHRNLTYY